MPNIDSQLQEAREKLLDLTPRNRFLSFRPSRSRTITIIDEIPREVYNTLVIKQAQMTFLADEGTQLDGQTVDQPSLFDGLSDDASIPNQEMEPIVWQLPVPDDSPAERHKDRYLQTSLRADILQKRLFLINQQARSVVEEQGFTVLYLALGFLEWKESQEETDVRIAPLILVPVELERSGVRKSFKLRWTEEDILTNVSLRAKLSEQRIELPDFLMPDDKQGIDEYFQAVEKAVLPMPGWRVRDEIHLDFFNFTKFVMYKDLDPTAWPNGLSPTDYALIWATLSPSSDRQAGLGFSEADVDEKLSAHNVYHVLDADPSQIAAIEDAKAGLNLVVEGPPGTGKSQTIVNMIAELLGSGRTVLFVSEKMAALEVVKSRLDHLGLGDFCLELHSRKSNKKEVLQELQRAISKQHPAPALTENTAERLETVKRELNGYAKALRKPLGRLGHSPFALFGIRERARSHFASVGRPMLRIDFPNPEKREQRQWAEAEEALATLASALPSVSPITRNPWLGCKPGMVLPADVEEIGKLIDECKESIDGLAGAINSLVQICATRCPLTLLTMEPTIDAAEVVLNSYPVSREVLLNTEWNAPNRQAEELIERIDLLQNRLSTVRSQFEARVLDYDVGSVLKDYGRLSTKLFKLLDHRYRDLKREISTWYLDRHGRADREIVADLERLAACLQLRREIRQAEERCVALFGAYWQGEQSDTEVLRSFAQWVVSFRGMLLTHVLSEEAVELVSTGMPKEHVKSAIEEARQSYERFVARRDSLISRIGAESKGVFGKEAEDVPFQTLASRLELWRAGLPELQHWSQFVAYRDSCLRTTAGPLVEHIDNDKLDPGDLIDCFEGNFADSLLRLAFKERPLLENFTGEIHESRIDRFADLDKTLIVSNRQRLAHKLFADRPQIAGGVSYGSAAGILLGEINRKRGHMPIRKLMLNAGSLIQRIKPCFMMSPLSIAQFLDPKTARFDVIVFDEASQVKPEDALGALLRCKQAVVIGDTKQLPPTTFFDHMIEEGDGYGDQESAAPISDTESILHLCRRSFPVKTLRWHYRSKHESLVAVSNQEFYDNALLIYPSPVDRSDDLGLELSHLRDTVYDRGRSSVNRMEARAVAEACIDHYRRSPNKSLGVGTFNVKQQRAILEEIEMQLHIHNEMEDDFRHDRDEHFFVKNLETIQGDERDVILISMGFGFDQNGRLSLNFGPLNQEGGERRLNVLISRARERCTIFSNFRARDLRIDENAPRGLRALKVFLEYAESRNLGSSEQTREDSDSPFEDAVCDCLKANGHEVRKQVGCAGFRVDLAVVDPQSPGRYLVGIECDGAKYHSSPVARDRDRLRQQILEGLGWQIHRVWSTDWYRNRTGSEKGLLDAVEHAKQGVGVPKGQQVCPPRTPVLPSISEGADEHPAVISRATDDAYRNAALDYQVCNSLGIPLYGALHEQTPQQLSKAVVRVVEVEGPVHGNEVVRRIRTLWGLGRTGHRIRDAIGRAMVLAVKEGQTCRRGDFLWPATNNGVNVRRRNEQSLAKIELICDEEIGEAIKIVLKLQFDTLPKDLVVQTSRLLGFRVTHEDTADRIQKVLDRLVKNMELQEMPNGMIGSPR